MATSTPTRLMTVEEFRQIPEPDGDFDYELHHGELIPVTRPRFKHYRAQHRLQRLLERFLGSIGFVGIEFPFIAEQDDLRVADVAFVRTDRLEGIDPEDHLRGAPDLVIEILSASNTAAEMYDREQLCLQHGCIEFWTVDLQRQKVRVARADRPARTYTVGGEIPLDSFGKGAIAVAEIMAAK